MDIINSVASICSIIGAIVAWKQYLKTKAASLAAITAKEYILARKNTIDLNELLKEAKSIETIIINYTINSETRTRVEIKKKTLYLFKFFYRN